MQPPERRRQTLPRSSPEIPHTIRWEKPESAPSSSPPEFPPAAAARGTSPTRVFPPSERSQSVPCTDRRQQCAAELNSTFPTPPASKAPPSTSPCAPQTARNLQRRSLSRGQATQNSALPECAPPAARRQSACYAKIRS